MRNLYPRMNKLFVKIMKFENNICRGCISLEKVEQKAVNLKNIKICYKKYNNFSYKLVKNPFFKHKLNEAGLRIVQIETFPFLLLLLFFLI